MYKQMIDQQYIQANDEKLSQKLSERAYKRHSSIYLHNETKKNLVTAQLSLESCPKIACFDLGSLVWVIRLYISLRLKMRENCSWLIYLYSANSTRDPN
jgi:hypothetical protein